MYCNHTTTNSSLFVEVALGKEKKIKYKINSMNDFLISNTMGIIASLAALGLNLNLIKNLKNFGINRRSRKYYKIKKIE